MKEQLAGIQQQSEGRSEEIVSFIFLFTCTERSEEGRTNLKKTSGYQMSM
jgi:hypothetical protein